MDDIRELRFLFQCKSEAASSQNIICRISIAKCIVGPDENARIKGSQSNSRSFAFVCVFFFIVTFLTKPVMCWCECS